MRWQNFHASVVCLLQHFRYDILSSSSHHNHLSNIAFCQIADGGGITRVKKGKYEVRVGTTPLYSPSEETSWLYGTYKTSLTF
jgi:hypothetical protein